MDPQVGTSGTGFSDTRDPFFHSLILTHQTTGKQYQLNIVDTPGLKEVSKTETSRRDDELLNLASKCVEKSVTSLNVVCFVSVAGMTHAHDTDAFAEIMNFLGKDYSEIAMMVLTHCDEYDDEDLETFQEDIRTHSLSKGFSDYCKLGIVRYGAFDTKKLKARKPHLREMIRDEILERNEAMRNDFCEKLIACVEKKKVVSELKRIYDEAQKEVEDLINKKVKQEQNKSSTPCTIL